MRRVSVLVLAALCLSLVTGIQPSAGQAADVVVYAAGDISCKAGDTIHPCKDAETDALIGADAGAIVALGDNQYETGSLKAFNAEFADYWGNHPANLLKPVPGNHEYRANTVAGMVAKGYFDYFQNVGASNRSDVVEVGSRAEGWYSSTMGDWKLILMNSGSICGSDRGPSCAEGSAQDDFLEQEVQSTPADMCILVAWHHPQYSNNLQSAYRNYSQIGPMWDSITDQAGGGPADILLVGHSHAYERFSKTTGMANPSSDGVREFVVGTGGKEPEKGFANVYPNITEAQSLKAGVLRLVLSEDQYSWQFDAIDGSQPDQGSPVACNA
jgi:hypothetical protein